MNKAIRYAVGGLSVAAALVASSASADTFRSIAGLGNSVTWNDTLVTPAGAWLRASLTLFDETWLNGKTGGRIDVTASAANNAYASGIKLQCKDVFSGAVKGDTNFVVRLNKTGNTDGDITRYCPQLHVGWFAEGGIDDNP